MFISVLDLFKVGIGPSSSHTLGPMVAANDFICRVRDSTVPEATISTASIRCILKGSLAFTGKGHATDRAVALGLHGYQPVELSEKDVTNIVNQIWGSDQITLSEKIHIAFKAAENIVFDKGEPLAEHPNGMIFELMDKDHKVILTETYFSIGGGFINTLNEISQLQAPLKMESSILCKYPFDSASSMLDMAKDNGLSIAAMKRVNELEHKTEAQLDDGMDKIWKSMKACIENGLEAEGILPGNLGVQRRASKLLKDLQSNPDTANINDWLCAYAMAVNEENAAGNMVVTAPTNCAAGVITAVLFYV